MIHEYAHNRESSHTPEKALPVFRGNFIYEPDNNSSDVKSVQLLVKRVLFLVLSDYITQVLSSARSHPVFFFSFVE